LEKAGTPTVTVCTDQFQFLARIAAENSGMPRLPIVIIPHPLGGLGEKEVREKADHILEEVLTGLIE
jgi:hypothetical protein